MTVLILDHGDAAAAHGDHHEPGPFQGFHGVQLHDPNGQGGGHHPTIAAARVLLHGVSLFSGDGFRLLLRIEGADGLAGVLELGIVPVHHHLGHQGDDLLLNAALPEDLGQALLDVVADIALAHGAAHVEGHGGGHVGGGFVLQNDAAHLGAVAVGNDHVVSGFDDVGDIGRGLFNNFQLGFGGGRLSSFLEGVPAQGDHYPFHRFPF